MYDHAYSMILLYIVYSEVDIVCLLYLKPTSFLKFHFLDLQRYYYYMFKTVIIKRKSIYNLHCIRLKSRSEILFG